MDQPAIRTYDGWRHQLVAYHEAARSEALYLVYWMGTGKSAVVVWLVNNLPCRHTLILCPSSVLGVWRREFARHTPDDLTRVLTLESTSSRTVANKMKEADTFLKSNGGRAKVICINYESAWREPFGSWALRQQWDLAVLDEAHRTKGASGKIGRYVDKLSFRAAKRLCLSGTPLPHSILDAHSQVRFLDRKIFGTWFGKFRARYAVTDKMFPSKVIRWINQQEFANKFASISISAGADTLDLPPISHDTRSFTLGAKAWRAYLELRDDLITLIDQGVITAANALVKIVRLQQLTSGHAVLDPEEGDDPDDRCKIWIDNGKETLLEELLEDLPAREPVVVFCRFRTDLDACERVAEKLGRRYGELSGRRKDLTQQGTMPEDVDLLGTQWASGGVGIDLTRAAYGVFYSGTHSLGNHDQAVARLHRPGQTRHVQFYHLVAKGTIDGEIYKALDARRDVIEAVLERMRKTKRGDTQQEELFT